MKPQHNHIKILIDLPASPIICPHFGLVHLVRSVIVIVETITSIYLYQINIKSLRSFQNTTTTHIKCIQNIYVLRSTGSGASLCLHITHGTPIPRLTAICAAQFV